MSHLDRGDIMMTATECLAQAEAMEARAALCLAEFRAEYQAIGQGWRLAASMAHWQDEWTKIFEDLN